MNSAWRHFNFCSGLALIISLGFINARSQTAPPSQANSLWLERSGTGWRLHFALGKTNGAFRIVRRDRVQTLASLGPVVAIVGLAGSPRTGVIDLPLTNSQAFFSLVGEQFPWFPPPPGMVIIPSGTFVMGSPTTEKERNDNETQHTVTLTRDFYMSKYEVTQKEYLAVTGNNPSYFTTKDYNGNPISPDLNRPVEQVSWHDATNYCGKLTASERLAGRLPVGWEYRLPTEAEWEYACRAGTSTVFHHGNDLPSGIANFWGRYEYAGGTGTVQNLNGTTLYRTTTVGSYVPNAFGLYDMHGNVWEWCLDGYGSYPNGSVTDSRGPSMGSYRVIRGGGWIRYAWVCRSACRDFYAPDVRDYNVGFRPVLAPGQ
jgi:formylglycine-generating enzyme required for sulfatase activity